MPIPRVIHVAGEILKHEEFVASTEIKPGMQIENVDDAGTTKWRPQASATTVQSRWFALEKIGYGPDEPYVAGEVVCAGMFYPGSIVNAIYPSGQDLSTLEYVQSNGDGKLKAATADTADAGLAFARVIERPGAITEDSRYQTEILS